MSGIGGLVERSETDIDDGRRGKTRLVKCERRKGKGERKRGDGRLVHALPRIRGSEHKRVRDGVRSGMTLFALVTSLAIAEIATIDSRMQRRASRGPESGSRRPGFRRYEIRERRWGNRRGREMETLLNTIS